MYAHRVTITPAVDARVHTKGKRDELTRLDRHSLQYNAIRYDSAAGYVGIAHNTLSPDSASGTDM